MNYIAVGSFVCRILRVLYRERGGGVASAKPEAQAQTLNMLQT